MLTGSTIPKTVSDETDADLLCWMSMRSEDPAQAEGAWAEFYERHVDYLYGVCSTRLKRCGLREDDIMDLVQATFLKVFEKAGAFQPPPERRGPDDDRAWVRCWLGKIAHNLLMDSFRRSPKLVLVENKKLDIEKPVEEERRPPSPRLNLIREALRTLTPREREVMLVSYAFYEPGKQLTIPEDDLKRLAADYGTTSVNLRQIRSRAMNKIKEFLGNQERQS
jgi:RNA polymerase sigma factor (sigma-70 family)